MKSIIKLLTLILAFAMTLSLVACNGEDDQSSTANCTGWAFEYDVKTREVEEGDNTVKEKYVLITGIFVADGTATALANGTLTELETLVIGENGKITVPVYVSENSDEVVYENNALKTTELTLGVGAAEGCKHFEIADDAFANQLIVKEAIVHSSVKVIGSASFAGCANLEKITLPHIGSEKDSVNAKKAFANIFGSAEAANCTSTSVNYNESGTATYFVPNALKEVVINYAEEKETVDNVETVKSVAIPAYAFNGLTTIEKITVTGNVTKVGKNAFENCSGALEINLPATVTEIGQKAFNGCSSLMVFDLSNFSALTTVYQQAFAGCTSLGYGKKTVNLPASLTYLGEKAFYGCTGITSINLANLEEISAYCFYGCSSLATVTSNKKASEVTLGEYAFEKCAEGIKYNYAKEAEDTQTQA